MSPNVHDFLRTTLGVNLGQGYGLTETNGGISLSTAQDLSVGRVGQPLPGVKIKLIDWSEGGYLVSNQMGHGPRGEILISGPMVAKGYYKIQDEDNFLQGEDGEMWFKTGDIGQIDTFDAALKIIDRKKDLVKLQMGEYVSLAKVETCLKVHPLVENICVVADSSKTFCVALLVPDMAQLTELAMKLEICLGFDELCENANLTETVTQILIEFSQRELQKFEIPHRFALISKSWTPETGLVTAAMKLKRKAVHNRYQTLINELYLRAPNSPPLNSHSLFSIKSKNA